MLTIQPFTLYDIWSYGGTSAWLYIYADETFKTADGRIYLQGNRKKLVKKIKCIVEGRNLIIPSTSIPTTTDSDVPTATLSAEFRSSQDEYAVTPFFVNYRISHLFGSTASWQMIRTDNQTTPAVDAPDYAITVPQVATLIDEYFKGVMIPKGAPGNPGLMALTREAANPDSPIAVGANEPSFLSRLQSFFRRGSASLAGVVTSIGASRRDLIFDSGESVTNDFFIPENINVKTEGEAFFNVANGKTLTLGRVDARQRFGGSGYTVYGRGAVSVIEMIHHISPTSNDITKNIRELMVSADLNKGIRATLPAGKFRTLGGHNYISGLTIEGAAFNQDGGNNGTVIELMPAGTSGRADHIFRIGGGTRQANFENITFQSADGTGQGILVEGTAGVDQPAFGINLDKVGFGAFDIGFNVHSLTNDNWQAANIDMRRVWFTGCREWFRSNTNNSQLTVDGGRGDVAGAAFDFQNGVWVGGNRIGFNLIRTGLTRIANIEVAGIPSPVPYFIDNPAHAANPATTYAKIPSTAFGNSTFIRVAGEHLSIDIENIQDEGLAYFLVNEVGWTASTISISRGLLQAIIQLNAACRLSIDGTTINGSGIVRAAYNAGAYAQARRHTFAGDLMTGVVGQNGATIAKNQARVFNLLSGNLGEGDAIDNLGRDSKLYETQEIPTLTDLTRPGRTVMTAQNNRVLDRIGLINQETKEFIENGEGDEIFYESKLNSAQELVWRNNQTNYGGFVFDGVGRFVKTLFAATNMIVGNTLTAVSGVFTGGLLVGGGSISKFNASIVAINPPSIPANSVGTVTVTIPNLAANDAIEFTSPTLPVGLSALKAQNNGNGTATIPLFNSSGAAIDDISRNWTYTVTR